MKVTTERKGGRRLISATAVFFVSDTAQFNEEFRGVS